MADINHCQVTAHILSIPFQCSRTQINYLNQNQSSFAYESEMKEYKQKLPISFEGVIGFSLTGSKMERQKKDILKYNIFVK